MRRTQNADTHALKQPRLSQNISPVHSSFAQVIASDMHLESESEKRSKNIDLHTAKKYSDTVDTFSLFLDQFLETDLRPIYCSLTCGREWSGELRVSNAGLPGQRVWGGSKGVNNFVSIFLFCFGCNASLVPVGHFRNISGHFFTWLVCGSFQ